MATIRITYCGMDGEGSTVREAKQDAAVMRQIAEPPVTVVIGNQAALVAMTHQGEWGNRLIARLAA